MVRESHGPREPSSGMLSQCVVAAQRGSSGNFIFGLMSTRYYSAATLLLGSEFKAEQQQPFPRWRLEGGPLSVVRSTYRVRIADSI